MLSLLIPSLAAAGVPAMPKMALPPPEYDVSGYELCLPSGLLVHVVNRDDPDHVAITSVIGGGTSAEGDETRGAAHLVEHLWFRSRPAGGTSPWDTGAGLAIGGSTYADATVYTTVGARADLADLLAWEMERIEDPLQGITAAEVASERAIIASEIAWRGEHSERAALRHLDALLWPAGHPYASTRVVNPDLTLDLLKRYAAASYRPETTAIRIEANLAGGAVDAALEEAIPAAFRSGNAKSCARGASSGAVPSPAKSAVSLIEAPVLRPRLYVAWSLPAAGGADETRNRLAVDVLTAFVWRRLGFVSGVRNDDLVEVGCYFVPGRLASRAVCSVELPVTASPEEALAKVKAELPNQWAHDFQIDRLGVIGHAAADRYVGAFADLESLDDDALAKRGFGTWYGRMDPVGPVLETIFSAKEAEVAAVAKLWLTPERAVAVALVPGTAPVAKGRPIPTQARLEVAKAPEWTARPPRLEGLVLHSLSNGISAWILPRPGAAGLARAAMVWRGGWATSPVPGTNDALDHSQRFSLSADTGELHRSLGLAWGAGFGAVADHRTTVGAAGNLDLQLWLQRSLVTNQTTDGSVRQVSLDKWAAPYLPFLSTHPAATTTATRRAHLLPGDRAGHVWWDRLRDARAAGGKQVGDWERAVWHPANTTLVVVGRVPGDGALGLAEKYLGSWVSKPGAAPAALPALPPPPARKAFHHAAPNVLADVDVSCRVPGRTAEQAPALAATRAILDRGVWQTLREGGDVYGIDVSLEPIDPRVSILTLSARVPPAQSGEAALALLDVIRAAQDPSPNVVLWGRRSAAGAMARRTSTAEGAFFALREAASEGRGPDTLRRWYADVERVDAAAIRGVLADCAGHEAITIVGPEASAPGLAIETVDWAASGAALAKDLR